MQPRAVAYRASTRTLLVASEGMNLLVEYDALLVEPAVKALRVYPVGHRGDAMTPVASTGGAPSAVVLSADESTAFVLARSTFDVVAIPLLDPFDGRRATAPSTMVRLADDPLGKSGAVGRRLYYDAADDLASGGLGCNGCHPDGRDDGHVWHLNGSNYAAFPQNSEPRYAEPGHETPSTRSGFARQTPMLAGRLRAAGRYGWHAQNETLGDRLVEGFQTHRHPFSGSGSLRDDGRTRHHAQCLVDFLATGLALPPREPRALSEEEARGRALFSSKETGCATCHVAEREYTDRGTYPMTERPGPSFESDPDKDFRTPSLLFVGGTPPYFHDGSARTLEELVSENRNRMGRTAQLSAADRAALVAFLRTL